MKSKDQKENWDLALRAWLDQEGGGEHVRVAHDNSCNARSVARSSLAFLSLSPAAVYPCPAPRASRQCSLSVAQPPSWGFFGDAKALAKWGAWELGALFALSSNFFLRAHASH